MEIERKSTRSHNMENSLGKKLWTCRKADCGMNGDHSTAVIVLWISVRTATNHEMHRTVLKKLRASPKNSPHIMASKVSLSRSQQPRHCPHPQL